MDFVKAWIDVALVLFTCILGMVEFDTMTTASHYLLVCFIVMTITFFFAVSMPSSRCIWVTALSALIALTPIIPLQPICFLAVTPCLLVRTVSYRQKAHAWNVLRVIRNYIEMDAWRRSSSVKKQ